MKILLLSDIHNEFGVLTDEPIQTDADVVVLAGDIDNGNHGANWARKVFSKPIIYVAGNHEYYNRITMSAVTNGLRGHCKRWGVHYLHNKTVGFENVRFIGTTLWTDYDLYRRRRESMIVARQQMNDYRYIYTDHGVALTPEDTIEFFEKSVNFLVNELEKPFGGKTVIVTHHAPSKKSIAKEFTGSALNPAYSSNLEYLMEIYKPALWCHGHTHASVDYVHDQTRVVANPRGYRNENKDFNVNLIIEV